MTEKKVDIFNRQSLNISNFLSISRIFLAVLAMILLIRGYNIWLIFSICIIAALTDTFDGYLARKLNQVTELGKILDPVADKIAIICVALALIYVRNFPYWLVIMILVRDLILVIAGLFVIGKLKIVISSNVPGKIMVTVLAVLIFSYILDIKFIQIYLVVLSTFLIILSFIGYCISYYKLIFSKMYSNERRKE